MVRYCGLLTPVSKHQTERVTRAKGSKLLFVHSSGYVDLARVSLLPHFMLCSELEYSRRLGHAINKFRKKKLGLEYLSTASAVTMIERCAIPWTYCISPALVPKPQDWLDHIGTHMARLLYVFANHCHRCSWILLSEFS
jgi:hypothetical protein